MWMEKIRRGVLQVSTDGGLWYVRPSLVERLQLLWTFRNFQFLSAEILTKHEHHLMEQLCAQSRLRKLHEEAAEAAGCVIGTLERHAIAANGRKPQQHFSMVKAQKNSA